MTRFSIKQVVLSGWLAGMALSAAAQTASPAAPAAATPTPSAQPGERHAHKPMMARHDPAERQAKMAERQAALKSRLQISAAQEPAWTTYIASLQHPGRGAATHPDRDALRSMTTPERINHMRALHAERQSEMDKRADATLRLYAALTPEQQKLFDTMGGARQGRGAHGHGPHGKEHAPAKS